MRLLIAAFIVALVCGSIARAHDHRHPELTEWFMSLHAHGIPCCDGQDATRLEDQDWSTKCDAGACHYTVNIEGRWYDVPDSAVVQGPNKAGTALVWPVPRWNGERKSYDIRCFMPGGGA